MKASGAYSLGILAGGSGRRWGGRDKGLLCLAGRPLIGTLYASRSHRVTETLVCCRENPWLYQHFADRVLCEAVPNRGPCGGIVALLAAATMSQITILPTDLIGNPTVVIEQLEEAWLSTDRALVLTDSEGKPSPCIRISRNLLGKCEQYLNLGGTRITGLLSAIGARSVKVPSQWLIDADDPETLRSCTNLIEQ